MSGDSILDSIDNPVSYNTFNKNLSFSRKILLTLFCLASVYIFSVSLSKVLLPEILSVVEVDTKLYEPIKIEFSILFPNIPAGFMEISVFDMSGSHNADLSSNIKKFRLDTVGKTIGEITIPPQFGPEILNRQTTCLDRLTSVDTDQIIITNTTDYKECQDEGWGDYDLSKKEGCRIVGYTMINRIPNQLIFRLKKLTETAENAEVFSDFNAMHTIESFLIKEVGPNMRCDKEITDFTTGTKGSRSYFLKIVSRFRMNLDGLSERITTFSHFTSERSSTNPEISFVFDFSPLIVNEKETRKGLWSFISTQLAVFGGFYSLYRLFGRIVDAAELRILEKFRRGKLY